MTTKEGGQMGLLNKTNGVANEKSKHDGQTGMLNRRTKKARQLGQSNWVAFGAAFWQGITGKT